MSETPRVLLFGAAGQLGARLNVALTNTGYDVTGIDRAAFDFATATQRDVEVRLRAVEPALVINAAAFTAVDDAEKARDAATRANATMPEIIARVAQAAELPLLHFSTDYVFDGARGAPYAEDYTTATVNHYGASKLAGEQAVAAHGGHVFRIQLVYAAGRKNFFTIIREALKTKDELHVVADQIAAPSFAGHIADAVARAAPKIIAGEIPASIYHLAAGGYTSRHGWACAIAKAAGSSARIIPVTSAEFPTPAARPRDTRLDCRKLAAYGITMPHWRDALRAAMEEAA